jgi:putative peptidoglycan lipid II flippase
MSQLGTDRAHYLISATALILARTAVMLGGFGAVVLLAAKFGATAETDAYFVARMIPVTLLSPLGIVFNLAFVPVYIGTRASQGRAEAAQLASAFLNITLLSSVVLTIVYIVFADGFVELLAPGFSPETRVPAVWMTRIMAVAMVFNSLHAVFDSVLNAERRFVASAASSLAVPAGTLFGVLVLADYWGITGLAIGVVLGFAVQGAALGPLMRQYFVGHRWSLGGGSPLVRETMAGLGLAGILILTWQINTAVGRMFASLLGEGALSALSFGTAFIGVFPILVAQPVYKVLYPELVRLVREGRSSDLRTLFSENYVMVAFMTFPLAAALVVFSGHVTGLVFAHGRFGGAAVAQTAEVITYRALAIPGSVADVLLIYYLQVGRRTALIAYIAAATVAANALFSWILMRLMGLGGIALAYSVVTLVRTIMMAGIASRLLGLPVYSHLASPLVKLAAAAAGATAAVYGVARMMADMDGRGTPMALLMTATASTVVGVGVYLLGNVVLKNERIWLLLGRIWRPSRSPERSVSDAGSMDCHS